MERERDIEAWLRRRIEDLGGMFLKFTSPGNDGAPDRIAIFPDGRIVFVELKTRTGRVGRLQMYQIRRLMDLHQQVCVVFGWDAARVFLCEMKRHSMSSAVYARDTVLPLERILKEGGDAKWSSCHTNTRNARSEE